MDITTHQLYTLLAQAWNEGFTEAERNFTVDINTLELKLNPVTNPYDGAVPTTHAARVAGATRGGA